MGLFRLLPVRIILSSVRTGLHFDCHFLSLGPIEDGYRPFCMEVLRLRFAQDFGWAQTDKSASKSTTSSKAALFGLPTRLQDSVASLQTAENSL